MPQVPIQRQMISTDVPGMQVPADTAIPNAMTQAGGQIAGVAFDVVEQVKKAEAVDAATQAHFQDRFDKADYIQKLKIQYPKGIIEDAQGNVQLNPDGTQRSITDEYRAWSAKRYSDNQQKMPTGLAQNIYKGVAQADFNDGLLQVQHEELQQKVQSYKDNSAALLLKSNDRLVQSPIVRDAYDNMDLMIQNSQAQSRILLSPAQALAEKRNIQKEVPQSLFNGMTNQVLYQSKKTGDRLKPINDALNVLYGQDPDSIARKAKGLDIISETMDPDQKAAFIKHFLNLAQGATVLDKNDVIQRIEAAKKSFEIGNKIGLPGQQLKFDVPLVPLIRDMNELRARPGSSGLTDNEYATHLGELVAMNLGAKVFSDPGYHLASEDQKNKIIVNTVQQADKQIKQWATDKVLSETPQVGIQAKLTIEEKLVQMRENDKEAMHKDYPSFVANWNPNVAAQTKVLATMVDPRQLKNPDMAKAMASRDAELEKLSNLSFGGRSNDFKLLTDQEAQNFVQALTKNPNMSDSDKSEMLVAMHDANRPTYVVKMNQLINDKGINAAYRFVLRDDNKIIQSENIAMIERGGEYLKRAEDMLRQNGKGTMNDLSDNVEKISGPTIRGLIQASTGSGVAQKNIEDMKRFVQVKAADIYYRDNGQTSLKDAVQQANDAILGRKYSTQQSGGGGSFPIFNGAGVANPTVLQNRYKMLDRDMTDVERTRFDINRNYYVTPQGLNEMMVAVPKGFSLGEDAASKEKARQKFYEQVQSTGKVVPTLDGRGAEIFYKDKTTNSDVRVTNTDGSPLFIPMNRMLQTRKDNRLPPGNPLFNRGVEAIGKSLPDSLTPPASKPGTPAPYLKPKSKINGTNLSK